jgi:hypothetical protein
VGTVTVTYSPPFWWWLLMLLAVVSIVVVAMSVVKDMVDGFIEQRRETRSVREARREIDAAFEEAVRAFMEEKGKP